MARSLARAALAIEADDRVVELATVARRLADDAGVELPAGLRLFELAPGGDPDGGARTMSDRPSTPDAGALALVRELEALLTAGERRRGAHYTPPAVADRVVALALDGSSLAPTVGDPACGGGAMLLAAARRLAADGLDRREIARELLWGADIDPVAVAVTEAAIALWSGGTAPANGHLVVADTLHGPADWGPPGGFDVVVGNPPFQGQLARATARSAAEVRRLRQRWQVEMSPYVDTAALFLVAAVDLVRPGGRVAMVQPQSTIAARDAGPVRAALAGRAHLRDLWAPTERLFSAGVHVCVPVLDRLDGEPPGDPPSWAGRLADECGVPPIELVGAPTIADVADVVAGFREEYYGLIPHVAEEGGRATPPDDGSSGHRLVTSGLIDVGRIRWGERPSRFAKRRWDRPVVDVAAVRASSTRLDSWLDRVLRPKIVVASQTLVVEAAPDRTGDVVPVIPAISVVPHDSDDVDRLAAALCSPPVSAWVARCAPGTALSPRALRISAPALGSIPLPSDEAAWEAASDALVAGDPDAFAAHATAMYGLAGDEAAAVIAWWHARRPRP